MHLTLRQVGTVGFLSSRAVSDLLYSIGVLAARSGLSVRALRHYESVGLLVPSARTPAGHRRYSAADVERLQQIVSLRALGLPLTEIGRALTTTDPFALLERHLAAVRARIAAEERLAERLAGLAAHLRQTGAASADDLLSLIHLTTMFEKHFTTDQLDALRERAEVIGQDHIESVQNAWPVLFAEFDALREAGVAPDAPETAPLVARAQGFIAEFTGGDASLRRSLDAAAQADKSAMYAAWGVAPELGAYYGAAMDAHGGA